MTLRKLKPSVKKAVMRVVIKTWTIINSWEVPKLVDFIRRTLTLTQKKDIARNIDHWLQEFNTNSRPASKKIHSRLQK